MHLLFDGVPAGVDLHAVRALPGVDRVHGLHVWAKGTSQVALTAHLVMPTPAADDSFLQHASAQLRDQFGIEHFTSRVVRVPFDAACAGLAPPSAGSPKIAPAAHLHGVGDHHTH